ncbi:MAG: 1-(5-phosphoribosyl)-5-[(5-phosphoribosylamino)methylideneamino]imidazole-4-carboxamide isomerase [Candidatus Omnitrophica bacterium]|nr:1-(5-phosphoribosyl)-5-[(5-phosphoribosylamino)methylideneamino]imidazole-4-carboxamide isomerase [Candidatus Omnitrophota bacterium]
MIIIPAIDIKDGKVVRLFKGQFDKVTEYSADPVDMARHWEAEGAPYVHVVDLDGAESGARRNQAAIKKIARELKIPVETGGGIRSRDVVDDYLNAGIARIILGTRVVQDRAFLAQVLLAHGDHIAVSLDCSNGFVAQRGWVETSTIKGTDLAKEFAGMGLKYVVYTDIARDGTLTGPNIDGLKEMLAVQGLQVIASGGIKDLNDIKTLLALGHKNLYGVITGKAIYEGKLDIKAAIELAGRPAGC